MSRSFNLKFQAYCEFLFLSSRELPQKFAVAVASHNSRMEVPSQNPEKEEQSPDKKESQSVIEKGVEEEAISGNQSADAIRTFLSCKVSFFLLDGTSFELTGD